MEENQDLKPEFQYFLDHQEEIAQKYQGRAVVIHGQEVIGNYRSVEEAVLETVKTHPLGTFLGQRAERGSECYTQRFHSRVTFGSE